MNNKDKHYHFVGIGGIGMGALAALVLAKGNKVSGSDIKENKITKNLRDQGADIKIGHEENNIIGADYVIFSSAIKDDNPEIILSKRNNIPTIKRAELLSKLMEGYESITVAGAHGKTTTTSMISHLLINVNLKPTTAIGGIINATSLHAQLGESKYFIAEVDESDGSFLFFSPTYSIITNIDFEHVDFYKSWENILEFYKKFIEKTKNDGKIFICGDDENLLQLAKKSNREFISYGFSANNDLQAKNLINNNMNLGSKFNCKMEDNNLGTIELAVPGRHNILNSLACICVGINLGIDFNKIRNSLQTYSGVQRRFQIKGKFDDILIVDDYGHHPSEIKVTLETAQAFKKKRLITVFQPHRYTRLEALFNDFAKNLINTDILIITDIYAANEKPIEGISSELLYNHIKEISNIEIKYIRKENVSDYLMDIIKAGDLILTLGAGDITNISDILVDRFKSSTSSYLNS